MVVAISEKRCGCYAHPSEKNDYNEAPEAFFILLMNAKTLDIQKPNPRIWNTKFMWSSMGKLVSQLPGVINFAYNLSFRRVITHWKGIFEKYTLCCQTVTLSTFWLWQAKKTLSRAPKRPWKYKKMYWYEKFQNNPVGIGGHPPIST